MAADGPSWNDGAVARNPCVSWAFLFGAGNGSPNAPNVVAILVLGFLLLSDFQSRPTKAF